MVRHFLHDFREDSPAIRTGIHLVERERKQGENDNNDNDDDDEHKMVPWMVWEEEKTASVERRTMKMMSSMLKHFGRFAQEEEE